MNWVELQLNRSSKVECEARNLDGKDRRAVNITVTNSECTGTSRRGAVLSLFFLPHRSPTTAESHHPARADHHAEVRSPGSTPFISPPHPPPPSSSTHRPVECLPYRGSVCKRWLPEKHQWAFDAASQPGLDLAARERTGKSLLSAVDAAGPFRKSNASCADAVRAVLCGLLFPACTRGPRDASGRPWKPAELCREHCVAVDQLFCPHGSAGRVLEAVRSGFANGSAERAVVTLGAAPCARLPQWSRLQATGGVQAEVEAPLCTAVRLEAHVGQEDAVSSDLICCTRRLSCEERAVADRRVLQGPR